VVLAGGESVRMGTPKESLDWGGVPLVAHVAETLVQAVAPGSVVVVARDGQLLPGLPAEVVVVGDTVEGIGPLQGLRDGLAALSGRAEVAFVAATDLPLLSPSFVRRVLDALEPGFDAAIPVVRGRQHVLASAYDVSLVSTVDELLASGERRVRALLERRRVRFLDEAELLSDPELADLDPELESVVGANTPAEYAAALARRG
jgi:molybdopterin-guanine dinucleotide biosynthesis protein A